MPLSCEEQSVSTRMLFGAGHYPSPAPAKAFGALSVVYNTEEAASFNTR